MDQENKKELSLIKKDFKSKNIIPAIIQNDIDVGLLTVEARNLINQIINEEDQTKSKDLIDLFNINQNKKSMVRAVKLSELMDVMTDEALMRLVSKPNEISNKELFDSLKVINDLLDKSRKQNSEIGDSPLIQINQQTNKVNVDTNNLSRENREHVKDAVLALLKQIPQYDNALNDDFIDITEDAHESNR